MEANYKVTFTGQLQADADPARAARKMAALTKSPVEKISTLLASGKPTVIGKGLTESQARQYYKKLTDIGLTIKVTKVESQRAQEVPAQAPPPISSTSPHTPPAMEQTQESTPPTPPKQDVSPNPYAAPAANLSAKPEGATEFLAEPRKVSAGQGWQWLMEGFRLFMAKPLTWIGIYFLFMLILIPTGIIPIIGSLASSVVAIVCGGGIMIGAHSLAENKGLRAGHLFSGFTENRNQLLLLGLYYLIGIITISLIAIVPIAGSLISAIMGNPDPTAIESAFTQNMPLFFIGMLVAMLLTFPFIMAFWLAPGLVAITGENAFAALKLSFRASIRNILPQLVYFLGILVACIVFGIVFGIIMGIMAAFAGEGGSILFAFLPFLLMLLLGAPAMIILPLSIYATFRDLFCVSS
ncbi:BPSS1780 family membrane protein [Desulfopila sp. IMCC35008]|uniref:BPSS1780 family membrane protein n=1 Tax=Desulfopila sp. IMCC35008 TaxID=2653858 RepID=UPI0013D30042|nr:BPSS1780 family membrane protein [Desulfopila sp. IMCC35008]